ncbi:hypothetical protein GGR51DRAFT_526319 [Nemania sp. FL0031]|nr:hypothetical protein GGR51DRAFT_526319 [Nemania sp. FL0031]
MVLVHILDKLTQTRGSTKTPGLMFVTSSVLDPQKTPDELYNRYYDEELLGHIMASSKTELALRYKNVKGTEVPVPYISLHPCEDCEYLCSPENLQLIEDANKSEILECDDISTLISFSLQPYSKFETFEGYSRESGDDDNGQRAPTLVVTAIEPAEGQDRNLKLWYECQHMDMLNMCRGFRRGTVYVRIDGVCPRYLELAEFGCEAEDLPEHQLSQVYTSNWSTMITNRSKVFQQDVFTLIKAQGPSYLQL